MSVYKVFFKEITLSDRSKATIKYWSEGKRIVVAAFDENDNQISTSTYDAMVEIADDFNSTFYQSLIEGLATNVESDLITNPDLHLRSK